YSPPNTQGILARQGFEIRIPLALIGFSIATLHLQKSDGVNSHAKPYTAPPSHRPFGLSALFCARRDSSHRAASRWNVAKDSRACSPTPVIPGGASLSPTRS